MVTAHRGHGAHGVTAILAAFAVLVVPAAAVALQLPAASAGVTAPPYTISFAGGDGCPRQDDVRADVAAHLQDASRAAGARVELRVSGASRHFAGELVATDAAGNRSSRAIDGTSCAEVAHALAFLAGMALELGGRLDTPPTSAPAAAPAAVPVRATTWAPDRPGPTFASVAAVSVRGGIAPGLRPVGEIGAEVISARTGRWVPAVRATVVMGQGAVGPVGSRIDLLLTGARLQLCPLRLARGSWEARPCAAAELGATWARRDTAAAAADGGFWAAAEASLYARWWATPELFVEVGGGALFPAVRTRYEPVSGVVGYVVPAVTSRAVITAGLRL